MHRAHFIYLFIYYLLLAVWGLRFCARASSSCGKRGPLFIAVRGPLTIAASLVAERRLSNCGSRAQLLHGMWDLPRPGLEPVSPALAGKFSTTAPPGKPRTHFRINKFEISSSQLLITEYCNKERSKGHEQQNHKLGSNQETNIWENIQSYQESKNAN